MFDSSSEYVDSYYAASCIDEQLRREHLQENLQVDVVIIGAGYTGLYTALNLAETGKSVAIIEASRVGWGDLAAMVDKLFPVFLVTCRRSRRHWGKTVQSKYGDWCKRRRAKFASVLHGTRSLVI